ncbi:Hsp33 family molecular chaperone HslO [Gallaecimonas pentaromativorans]|uniref:Hsp33 family molecular chaperone HslO n=1 Tax=Gallaecimonas pentaromativorans TaxID=584787 RepID=UPI00067E66DE|nr:Hsp33 family molecular chaperone HslO [Gallaecimonas pentaromativorans]MED5526048.1 Hsp33 family molecular chaperone HslO [Pseudomonadota bacterium]
MAQDKLYRFVFENAQVRGELVQLDESFEAIIANHNYPQPIQRLLGQLMAATSLLTATVKFEGEITVQLQGDGPVSLAVINGTHQQVLRGVARYQGEVPDGTLAEMVGKGYLVITISPKDGERYQGVVGLEGDNLAQVLEGYFANSEQLPTRLWLFAEGQKAAGMMLQVLPAAEDEESQFEHLTTLTDTIKAEELFELGAEDVLHRLFHQEEVRLFEPQPVSFKCTCSRERCESALISLGQDEVEKLVAEHDGALDMDCEYCRKQYRFDSVDVAGIFAGAKDAPQSTQ